MGMSAPLKELYSLVYMAPVGENVFEHEYDHVFTGTSSEDPHPSPEEVCEWKWMSPEDISADIDAHPGNYTVWFQLIFKDTVKRFQQ